MVSSAPTVSHVAATGDANTRTFAPATKLAVWCDRLIEAGWLAALVVAPLFFNIYSSRVFEPDKLTTVRSIALAMSLIWLVKFVEEWRNPQRHTRLNWRTPLILPTMILVVVYVVSTMLSVAPRTSLLGSYQRLQGTYTTFSYIVIFLMIVQGLRTRPQFDRLVNVVIITSLPIALYGMLQRAQLDPLPWGGDVSERVAGNMGNAIFIAAYLIMAFFLTVGRLAETFAHVVSASRARLADVFRAACFILIALINAFVVLVLAGSRGPQLGFLTGLFFISLLLVQLVRRRKLRLGLTMGMIGASIAGLALIIGLNVPTLTALDPIRQLPFFGRIATAFSTDSGSNLVRLLIWRGAVDMVQPHQPIQNPDGSPDAFNALRPFIGYGPESMYVAYNRFYPSALTTVEARNASPDRSHNETWDSLVITGIVGFLAYMLLFGAVFYFAFKWIGLIASRAERILFPVLWVVGGALGGLAFTLLDEPAMLGVGIAAGAAAGLVLYLIVSAVLNARSSDEATAHTGLHLRDQIMLVALISAVASHFIEIHLGIAIASTRTHFWAFIGMIVVLGMGYLEDAKPAEPAAGPAPEPAPATANPATAAGQRRQRAQAQAQTARTKPSGGRGSGLPFWFADVGASALLLGLILAVMAFCFTTNSDRLSTAGVVFGNALTLVRGQPSLGVALIFLTTWIVGTIIIVADAHRNDRLGEGAPPAVIATAAALVLALSALVWITFGTFLAGRLVELVTARQGGVDDILGIADSLGLFPMYLYILIGAVMIGFAMLLRRDAVSVPKAGATVAGATVFACVGLITLFGIRSSNLQPIAADIIYKQANPWDGQGNNVLQQGTTVQGWDLAIEHYRKAIQLAPNEDFYYLWLGRALLEKAKGTQAAQAQRQYPDQVLFSDVIYDGTRWDRTRFPLPSATMSREDLLVAARTILDEARRINPLNTDHSANLARMWRQSGDISADATTRRQRFENSSKEYAVATSLSPNNSQLWNEWASLYLYSLGDPTEAMKKLDQSLSIDKFFDQTYLLRGDYLMQQANQLDQQRQQAARDLAAITDTQRLDALKAEQQRLDVEHKSRLSEARIQFTQAISVNRNSGQAYNVLTYINQQLGDLAGAIQTAERQVAQFPQDWNAHKNLMLLYNEAKQTDKARAAGERALSLAPADQQAALQSFLSQLPRP